MSTPARDMYKIAYCDMGDDNEDPPSTRETTTSEAIEKSMQKHRDDIRGVLETIEAMNKEFSLDNQSKMGVKNQLGHNDLAKPPVYMSTTVPMSVQATSEELPMWMKLSSWMLSRKNKTMKKNISNNDKLHYNDNQFPRAFGFAVPLKVAPWGTRDEKPDQTHLLMAPLENGDSSTGGRKKLVIPTTIWLVLFLLALSSVFILIGISQVISILSILQFRLVDISNQQKQLRPSIWFDSSMGDHIHNHNHHHNHQRPSPYINSLPYDHNGLSWTHIADNLKNQRVHHHFIPGYARSQLENKVPIKHEIETQPAIEERTSIFSRLFDEQKQGRHTDTAKTTTTTTEKPGKDSQHTMEAIINTENRPLWSWIIGNVTVQKSMDLGVSSDGVLKKAPARWQGHNIRAPAKYDYTAHATLWFLAPSAANFEYKCGATLINAHWLVTAAHCLDSYLNDVHHVRSGIHKHPRQLIAIVRAYREEDNHESEENRWLFGSLPIAVEVSRRVVHPQYDSDALEKSSRLPHDIALLKTGKIIEFPTGLAKAYPSVLNDIFVGTNFADRSTQVKYPKLARYSQDFTGQRCRIPVRALPNHGVAKLSRGLLSTKAPTNFTEVDLPIVENDACGRTLTERFYSTVIGKGDFCAGGEKDRDACQGNGGTGLYCFDSKSESLVLKGINSWGIGCGREGVPGVYTDIGYYKDWIVSVMENFRTI